MRLDKFNTPIFNESDVFSIMYEGNTSILSSLTVDPSQELSTLEEIGGFKFKCPPTDTNISEFDKKQQNEWLMPKEYHTFDVKTFCINKCTTDIEVQRVNDELKAFSEHNMDKVLQWLKYFVDTCAKNNVVSGVGRGSSVSSYVLYLLGVHKINSLKYNLDWTEFLR